MRRRYGVRRASKVVSTLGTANLDRKDGQAPALCLFCREYGSSREDVFALWISRLIRDAGPFDLAVTHGRSKTGLRKIGVYSRAPCRTCNTGWMSRLEQAAAPFLRPAILGQPTEWDADAQKVVATWAFKTALMLDRSNPVGFKVPAQHFAHLYDHAEPPGGSVQIAVGAYRPTPGERPLGATAGISAGPTSHRDSYRIAFSVGQLVFEINGYAGRGISPVAVQTFVQTPDMIVPMWNSYPPVWPRLSMTFRWPPPDGFAIDNQGLRRLSDDPLMQPLEYSSVAL